MRRYEQVCILRPSLSEEEITRIIDYATQLIQEDEGSVIFLNKWGMRKLAYPIKKESQGYYVLCDFAASPTVVSEIERKFRIDDAVLKYLTVKISDEISAEEIETARSEAEARAIVPETEEETVAPTEEKTEESVGNSVAAPEEKVVEAPAEEDSVEASAELDSDGQETEEPVQ
jgi:small subunit ribosomal protein S6